MFGCLYDVLIACKNFLERAFGVHEAQGFLGIKLVVLTTKNYALQILLQVFKFARNRVEIKFFVEKVNEILRNLFNMQHHYLLRCNQRIRWIASYFKIENSVEVLDE